MTKRHVCTTGCRKEIKLVGQNTVLPVTKEGGKGELGCFLKHTEEISHMVAYIFPEENPQNLFYILLGSSGPGRLQVQK